MDEIGDEVSILRDRDTEEVLSYEADDSPYPEVRAVVQPVDDLSMPINTLRVWTIGLIFTIVSAFDFGPIPRRRENSFSYRSVVV